MANQDETELTPPASSPTNDDRLPTHEFVAHESTIITVGVSKDDPNIVVRVEDEHVPPASQPNIPAANPGAISWFTRHGYAGIWYLIYAGILVVMYPSLSQLVQLKFENTKKSPFETNGFLCNMSVIAYVTAIPISVILFATKARLESQNRERFSSSINNITHAFLKGVFVLSAILGPLSLVIVLLTPYGSE